MRMDTPNAFRRTSLGELSATSQIPYRRNMGASTNVPYRRQMGGLFDSLGIDMSSITSGISDLASTYLDVKSVESALTPSTLQYGTAPAVAPAKPATPPAPAGSIMGLSPTTLLLGALAIGAIIYFKRR